MKYTHVYRNAHALTYTLKFLIWLAGWLDISNAHTHTIIFSLFLQAFPCIRSLLKFTLSVSVLQLLSLSFYGRTLLNILLLFFISFYFFVTNTHTHAHTIQLYDVCCWCCYREEDLPTEKPTDPKTQLKFKDIM